MIDAWTPAKAQAWLKKNGYKPIKPMHRVGEEMRFRISSPAGLTEFRTITLPNGVHIVRGRKK